MTVCTLAFFLAAALSGFVLPETGPVPADRPHRAAETDIQGPSHGTDEARPDEELPVEKEDPKNFAACTAELMAMGADFSPAKPIDDGKGCGIDRPLTVRSLGDGVALLPPGTLRCRTALNLARWTQQIVIPMLRKARPEEALAAIDQASTYVCRKRNNADTGRISEHARGNAVDIAGFTFKSGGTLMIAPREEDTTLNGAFQRAVTAAACLYFNTVLDPGSDAAHETHLHLDMLERKGGYLYCR